MDGTRTTDLPQKSLVTHFLANTDEGGVVSTSRVPVEAAAAQIAGIIGPETAVVPVETRTLSAPPGSPGVGKHWIVGAAPTGAWSGKADNIATWDGTAWSFQAPSDGYSAIVIDEGALYFYSGANSKWTITTSDTIVLPTWSALNAITGVKVGQRAEVIGDAGTHTDPVVGGTVANSGVFSWSSSPAGWRWLNAQTKANQTDLDAANLRVGALEAADTVYNAAVDAISTRQIIGTEATPVSGTSLSNKPYVFSEVVTRAGFITKIAGYVINAGIIRIKRFTKSGDTFTQVGSDYVLTTFSTGAFSLALPISGPGAIPVAAGEYLGFYGGISAGVNVIGRTASGVPITGQYAPATETGNTSSFTDSAVDNGVRVELSLTVSTPTVTETRMLTAERGNILSFEAIKDLLAAESVFSMSSVFFDHAGAWYDFTDKRWLYQNSAGTTPVTADGQLIGYVKDRSIHGYDFAVEGDSFRPTFKTAVVNGKSGARFASGNYLKSIKNGLTRNIARIHIFSVVKYTSAAGSQTVIEHQTPADGSRIFHGNRIDATGSRPAGLVRQADGDAGNFAEGPFYAKTTGFDLQETVANFDLGQLFHFLNGDNSIEGFSSLPTSLNTTDADEAASYIGARVATNPFVGDMVESIEVVGELDEVTRAAINNYLATKYGLTIGNLEYYNSAGPLPGIMFWFNDPRVIKLSGVTEKYAVGAISPGGSIILGNYVFTGDSAAVSHVILNRKFQWDDHAQVCFVQLADDHVLALYAQHAGVGVWVQKTSVAGDLSAWAAPVDKASQIKMDADTYFYSYTNVVRLSGESNRLYLFGRAENQIDDTEYWYYSKSDDDGETFSVGKRIWGPQRPYTKVIQNGTSRIDFFFNDSHPNIVSTNNCYHCYLQGGNWHKSDGTVIGDDTALPLNFATGPTKVYDAVAAGTGRSWVFDLCIDANTNRPVGCFVTYNSPQAAPYKYRQARWNGSAWVNKLICDAGGALIPQQLHYTGGVISDPEDPNIVYCSRQVDGSGNYSSSGQWQLFKYVTADGGDTWTPTQLTTDPAAFAIRPFIPAGSRRLYYTTGDLYGPQYNSPWRAKVAWLTIT